MKIGVFGLWHLGCTIAASWSKLGFNVIGYDYDYLTIDKLKNGIIPIFEPFLEEIINENLILGKLKFTHNQNDLSDCDYVFISYDTPVNNDDTSDISILTNSVTDLSKILKDNSIVIISSQTPVGICGELCKKLKNYNPTLELAYSPENLRLGEAIECYLHPDRIILGINNKKTETACLNLFSNIQGDVMCMNLESAEMVKHGINSYLSMSIVFANHLADVCSEKGANIKDVIMGIKSDPRIGNKAYLSPGIGFSGGTLGRDLKALKNTNVEGSKLFGIIYDLNEERKYGIIRKIKKCFGNLKGKNIGVLGLTYKAGTSTLRRSLPIEIINLMIEEEAKVIAYDPKADYNDLILTDINFLIAESISDLLKKVNYIIILTDWIDFKNFDWSSINKNISILDTKNYLDINNEKIKYYTL
jgi:UDPglucose 6-dehydrogenase